ncbi:hypothetical protein GECvBGOT_gp183c [Salmonella phage GEC_vB_GOT]|nr:hypothetical protein GECvBGOT_gp183c [Salmonella phage GEC_vB_GOT]
MNIQFTACSNELNTIYRPRRPLTISSSLE